MAHPLARPFVIRETLRGELLETEFRGYACPCGTVWVLSARRVTTTTKTLAESGAWLLEFREEI